MKKIIKIITFCITHSILLILFINSTIKYNKLKKSSHEKERLDHLTKLANRKALYEHLLDSKKHNEDIAIFMIDIDYFKKYNDTYGHIAGDRCLKVVADCFCSISENYNIKFYRYGGEEFIGVYYGNYIESISLADIICKTVESLNIKHINNITHNVVTISLGIAMMDNDDTPNNAIEKADAALYVSKERGKNTYTMYNESMHNEYYSTRIRRS